MKALFRVVKGPGGGRQAQTARVCYEDSGGVGRFRGQGTGPSVFNGHWEPLAPHGPSVSIRAHELEKVHERLV